MPRAFGKHVFAVFAGSYIGGTTEVERLSLREKYAKSAVSSVLHNSHNGLTKILGVSHFGGERASIQVRLYARLAGAERAFFPGKGQAHRATHSQYLFRR